MTQTMSTLRNEGETNPEISVITSSAAAATSDETPTPSPATTPAPQSDFISRSKNYCSENLGLCAGAPSGFLVIVIFAIAMKRRKNNSREKKFAGEIGVGDSGSNVLDHSSQNWMVSSNPVQHSFKNPTNAESGAYAAYDDDEEMMNQIHGSGVVDDDDANVGDELEDDEINAYLDNLEQELDEHEYSNL